MGNLEETPKLGSLDDFLGIIPGIMSQTDNGLSILFQQNKTSCKTIDIGNEVKHVFNFTMVLYNRGHVCDEFPFGDFFLNSQGEINGWIEDYVRHIANDLEKKYNLHTKYNSQKKTIEISRNSI